MTGVDLWINDVYMGKTPVVTDVHEFRDKVKLVTQPPRNATEGLSPYRTRYMGFSGNGRPAGSSISPYYARVSFNGFEGYGSGGQNFRGSSSHGSTTGFNFQLELRAAGFDRWAPLLIERPIYLEQGQEQDLGLVQLEGAISVSIKVVDATGKPIKDAFVTIRYNNLSYGIEVGSTNSQGTKSIRLFPRREGKIAASWGDRSHGERLGQVEFKPDDIVKDREFKIVLRPRD